MRDGRDAIAPMRRDEDDALLQERGIEWIRVVCTISDEASRVLRDKSSGKRLFSQGDLVRRSRRHTDGDWKRALVRNNHDFGAFPTLRGSHTRPPFLAEANVPSRKQVLSFIRPRSSMSSARASRIRSKVPERTHPWNRRWQV